MATKMMMKIGKYLTMKLLTVLKDGSKGLWSSLTRNLLKVRIKAGRTVTAPITPKMTPLAMTIPRSIPRVKDMKQRAIKPATVVADEPKTELMVFLMASTMAASEDWPDFNSSRKECQRKME